MNIKKEMVLYVWLSRVIITFAIFGFIAPFLVSYPDDILVILGFGLIIATIIYWIKLFIKLIMKFKEDNDAY